MGDTATVAVLFCDVVGSTERLTRMGDEAGDDFRRRLVAGLRRDAVDHSGTVVKHLGDGLMVVFEQSAIDAVDCASAMHSTAADIEPDDPVELRIGISIGEVAHEDDDWFGTPVVEAARLCAVAGSRRTFAPALLASIIGSRRRDHRFRPVGEMSLKGLGAPIQVVEIDGPDEPAEPEESAVPDADSSGPPRHGPGRRRRTLAAVGALAAIALAIGAISFLAPDRDRADRELVADGSPSPGFVSAAEGYTPRVEPADCPAAVASSAPGATCRELVVPESRAHPDGRQLRVPVVSVPGPAGSKVAPVVVLDVNEPATTALAEVTDVHLVGLRGFAAGGDPPLLCPELQTAWSTAFAVRADDPTAIAQRAGAARECAARLREAGVQLEGYSMTEAADDLRDVVQALDLGRVTVAAGGYTTTAAVAWARANPGSVVSMLLTNPVPPGSSAMADPAGALSASFARLRELCAADAACHAGYPDLAAAYGQRFGQLDATPVPVITTSLGGVDPFDVLLDGRRYTAGLEAAMRETARLGLVPSAVQGASDELTAAAGIAEDVAFFAGPVLSGAFLSLTCGYDGPLNRTAEISDAAMRQYAGANEPTYGRLCEAWGVPSVLEELSRPLTLDVPVLLASGGLSMSGVNDWAAVMASSLEQAVVIDVPTVSEDLVFAPPPCLRSLRAKFLRDPSAELDTSACEDDPPGIDFVVPT